MWIRELEVRNFAGIRSASLELGPGLNVLYGPNEQGKSSLVHAIRAALLLPDSSSARRDFVDWHTDQAPQVTIVFETEPHRIWKVRKSFGSGSEGWSYLEFSKDGVTFGQEAKGREVDGRLREILRWGIEGPGGRTRTRGLPESFLATALLADQKDVEAILHRGLGEDGDESGKRRLTEALQALAEDPAFRRIVEATQARVDEAFTATGRRRSGRGSPWVELRDQRRNVTVRQAEVRAQVEESRGAEQRVARLREEVDSARERVNAARDDLKAAESARDAAALRQAAEEKVEHARQERERVAALHAQVDATRGELEKREAELAVAIEGRKVAAEQNRQAEEAVERAREKLRTLESGDFEQKRRLREEQIGRALVELEGREREARALRARAVRVGELEEKARAARDEITERTEAVAKAVEKLEEEENRLAEAERALRAAEEQRVAMDLIAARRDLGEASEKARAVEEQSVLAERNRARAQEIREEVGGSGLPTEEEMKLLEDIARRLEATEAALAVGLSVTVRPRRKLDVTVEVDDEEGERALPVSGEATVDAQRRVSLRLKDVADVTVLGGGAERRQALNELREEWDGRTRPVFASAGVAGLEQLKEKMRVAIGKREEAASLEASAKEAEARVEGAGDVGEAVRASEKDVSEAESQVVAVLGEGTCVEELVERWEEAAKVAQDELVQTRQQLRSAVKEAEAKVAELRQKAGAEKAVVESKAPEAEALEREASFVAEALEGEWKIVEKRAGEEAEAAAESRAEKQKELEGMADEGTAELDGAREGVESGEATLTEAKAVLEKAQEREKDSQKKLAELQGALRVQSEAADREDLPAAEARLEKQLAELEAHPAPSIQVTEERLAELRVAIEKVEAEYQQLQGEYQQAEGALQQVGGQYVQERLQQVEESLQALEEREHETELDYEAWRLLLETVRESEREDAVHLGNALVGPIADRMSKLTQGRYEGLGIGPKLQTQSVEVAGEARQLSALSVGTREQLATVLRLTIAEAMKSMLVLDDQLVQSDEERMKWLAAFMKECAQQFQILVFTCRPEEYRVDMDGGVERREIELTGVVERSAKA